jgi:hypothetical protein
MGTLSWQKVLKLSCMFTAGHHASEALFDGKMAHLLFSKLLGLVCPRDWSEREALRQALELSGRQVLQLSFRHNACRHHAIKIFRRNIQILSRGATRGLKPAERDGLEAPTQDVSNKLKRSRGDDCRKRVPRVATRKRNGRESKFILVYCVKGADSKILCAEKKRKNNKRDSRIANIPGRRRFKAAVVSLSWRGCPPRTASLRIGP